MLDLQKEPPAILKRKELSLDLSGIGKGFAVDQVAELLSEAQCSRFLVNIGGEIRTTIPTHQHRPWRIGIEDPDGSGEIFASVTISNGALATSGRYRNFRTFEHQTYSHLIDPETGYPVSDELASVTVYHNHADEADALSTALFVMGVESAYQFAIENEIAVFLIYWDSKENRFNTEISPKMVGLVQSYN